MSEVVGEAVVKIKTDDSGVESGAKQSGAKAGKSAGSGFASSFKGAVAGVAAVAGVGLAADQVVGFFKDAVGGASDLNETVSKTHVVFGDAADAIINFAGQGSAKLGQSKQAALDAASTFGVFGKAAGLSGKDLSGFSTDLVSLSTDLASFHNATPEETVQALGSALRGEAEPMRRFGVLLDDASLKAEAMRQGLIKNTKTALTPQQKTLAAYALIMNKTKDAQGDFARTSDGLSNQQRIAAAQFEDVRTKLGSALLPAVLAVTKAVNALLSGTSPLSPVLSAIGAVLGATLVPGLKLLWATITGTISVLSALVGWIKQNAVAAGLFAAAILLLLSPLIVMNVVIGLLTVTITIYNAVTKAIAFATRAWGIAQMFLNSALLANPIGLILVALLALAGLFVILWKRSETFRTIVRAVWSGIKSAVLAVVNWFKGPFKSFFTTTLPDFFRNAWDKVKAFTKTALKFLLVILFPFPTLVAVIIRKFGPKMLEIFRNAWQAARDVFRNGISAVTDFVRGLPGRIAAFAGNMLSAGKRVGSSIIQGILSGLRAAGGFVGDLASSIKSAINGALHLPFTIHGPGPLPDFTIPAFARGGFVGGAGTMALVGERGRELVFLPGGSQVIPNQQTERLLTQRNATINVMLPTGDPQAAALAVMNRLATI